eukprot:scaffold23306_cov125-Isochrysis_galbana.AAC.4
MFTLARSNSPHLPRVPRATSACVPLSMSMSLCLRPCYCCRPLCACARCRLVPCRACVRCAPAHVFHNSNRAVHPFTPATVPNHPFTARLSKPHACMHGIVRSTLCLPWPMERQRTRCKCPVFPEP